MNINLLEDFEIKFKRFDKKRTIETQLNELITELKQTGIKIVESSKYQKGYGEGICLILTQLLDKYLINQNFIFKRAKLVETTVNELPSDFEEVILEDNINLNSNTHYNTGGSDKPLSSYNVRNNLAKPTTYSASKRYSSVSSATTQGNKFHVN